MTDLATLKAAGRVQQGLGDAVAALCCHPAEDHTLFAAAGSAVLQLDLRRGLDSAAVLRSFAVNQDEVNSVAVSAANGGWLAAGDDSGEVQVISLQLPAAPAAAAAGAEAATAAEAGAQATAEAAAAAAAAAAEPVRPAAAYKTLRRGHTNICSAVAFRPHRPWELLSGGLDASVVRWDYSRLRPLHSWSLNSEATASGGGLGCQAAPLQHHAGAGAAATRWLPLQKHPALRKTTPLSPAPSPAGQLFNPPMVHCMAVPQCEDRGLCRLVAVGRGDGAISLYDADYKPGATTGTGGSGGKKGGSKARQRTASGPQQQQAQQARQQLAGPPAVPGRLALLGREQGGHTAAVNSVSFFQGSAWQQLLSAGNDRRLLLWNWRAQAAVLEAGQEAGEEAAEAAEAAAEGEPSSSPSSSMRHGGGSGQAGVTGSSGSRGGDSEDAAVCSRPLIAAEHKHARKINWACSADLPGCAYNVFLADTGRRITALALA